MVVPVPLLVPEELPSSAPVFVSCDWLDQGVPAVSAQDIQRQAQRTLVAIPTQTSARRND